LTTITIINGGPIVSDEHLSTLLPRITEEILKKSKVDSVYTEIWNMTDQEEVKKHYKQYQYNKHLNYFIKLDDSKSVINRISKRTRRYIRNAGNELTIQQVSSLGELGLLYECLKSTYDRISLPLISKNIFEDLYNSNIGIFLVCYYKNEAIASRVILPFGNEIYDWYGGAKEEYLMHKPNEILINWILKYGLDNNYKWFNFGGAGKPEEYYGPREFKSKFGGDLAEYGRYRYIHSNVKYELLKHSIKLYKKIN